MHSHSPAPDSCAATYALLLPEIDALPSSEVKQVNLDVLSVVTRVLGAVPRIAELHAQAAVDLPHVNLGQFAKLTDYAWALTHADVLLRTAHPATALAPLLHEARELRELLHAEANLRVLRGTASNAQLRELHGGKGRLHLASDLAHLAALLGRPDATMPQQHATADTALVERARALSGSLLKQLGRRQHAPDAIAQVTDRRNRAFTLLVQHYDQARRCAGYLRYFQGDAELYVPSLYAKRPARKKPRTKKTAGRAAD